MDTQPQLRRPGQAADLPAILRLIRDAIAHMRQQGIDQWDDIYPDSETLRADLAAGELHLIEASSRIAGIIVLNDRFPGEYNQIAWRFRSPALIVHRLCIHPAYHRQGMARQLMSFAHATALAGGHGSIRLDAFAANHGALSLYHSLGYRIAGSVTFRKGLFHCFERQIV